MGVTTNNKSASCCALFARWREQAYYFLSVLHDNQTEVLLHADNQNPNDNDILDSLINVLLSHEQKQDIKTKHENKRTAYLLFGIICGYVLIIFVVYYSIVQQRAIQANITADFV